MYNISIETKKSKKVLVCDDFDEVVADLKRIYKEARARRQGGVTFGNSKYNKPYTNDDMVINVYASINHNGMKLDFFLQADTDFWKTIYTQK